MEVLARLLEAGDRDVLALVRAGSKEAAEERLDGVLRKLWRDPAPYRGRVHAVAGDLTEPGLGIDAAERTALAEGVGAVLHCAASISFDLPLDGGAGDQRRGHARGDRARPRGEALGRLERFVHVSTAYVAGAYPGTFRERQLDAGQRFRNTYEQTKLEAEQLVRRGRRPLARGGAAEHRRGRVRHAAGPRRSTSSTGRCARSRAGCSTRCPPTRRGASTSCRSTTSPTRSSTCSTAARPACSTSWPAATRRRSPS